MLDALRQHARIGEVTLVADFAIYSDRRREMLTGWPLPGVQAAGKRIMLVYPIPRAPFDATVASGLIETRGGDPERFGLPERRRSSAGPTASPPRPMRLGSSRRPSSAAVRRAGPTRATPACSISMRFDPSLAGARLLAAGGFGSSRRIAAK